MLSPAVCSLRWMPSAIRYETKLRSHAFGIENEKKKDRKKKMGEKEMGECERVNAHRVRTRERYLRILRGSFALNTHVKPTNV